MSPTEAIVPLCDIEPHKPLNSPIKEGAIMLRDFKPRLYQEKILSTATLKDTLVVLPTGMGKTALAMMLAVQRLNQYPDSKVLFLAPTKPLVEQHLETFRKHMTIDEEKLAVFTGTVRPAKRQEQFKDAQIIFSTPQGMENDIISNRISLEDVSLITVDEAHKATGNYSYCFICKRYYATAKHPKVLGLTASPGTELEKITEVCKNLSVEDIEVRTQEDPDVKPYIQEVKIEWHKVDLPTSFKVVKKMLEKCFKSKLYNMKELGTISSYQASSITKTELLKLQAGLHARIARGDKGMEMLRSVSLAAEAMKVQHAIELLETQGIEPLRKYMQRMEDEALTTKVKAVKNLVEDQNFKDACSRIKHLSDADVEHPKMIELREIVKKECQKEDVKIIVFSQFRDTIVKIAEHLNELPKATAKVFVGQAKKNGTGLSQKEQKAILDEFREGGFNVLCASSVAEEGLDIPSVDIVIFYEPIPSAIRSIQRRGRTGRLEKGRVIMLMAKDTRDEGYRWSSHHKEKKMYRVLRELKRNMSLQSVDVRSTPRSNETLTQYMKPEMKVIVDDREKGSHTVKGLIELGVQVELQRLESADFLLSERCGVEFKSVLDFVNSIIDQRLLEQVRELKRRYEKPLLIIEGEEDIYSQRNIHPNAIRGMLSAITVSYGIPVLYTKNPKDSAALMQITAKREAEYLNKDLNRHPKKGISLGQTQEYIVSSLPGVGPVLARPLLKRFKSVKGVVNASPEDLQKVEKIGEKKAKEIQRILTEEYEE